ncbi:hypothetical protein DAKH74_050000 [Maudiozyma humilis]|uniref:YBL029Wp-like protein n=1 Tax=Maudiozyma humilis TaxID=51915 RepID=A0AAV5S3R7_MAUHU|nr:hypothetical protein DAKH74_050000 [Kazachstania humilis]
MPFQNIDNFSLSDNENLLNPTSLDLPMNYLNSYNLNNNNSLQQDIAANDLSLDLGTLNPMEDLGLVNPANLFPKLYSGLNDADYDDLATTQFSNPISNSSFSSSSASLSSLIEDDRHTSNASPLSEENETLVDGNDKIGAAEQINKGEVKASSVFNGLNSQAKITIEFPQKYEDGSLNDFLTPVSSITMSYDDLLFQSNTIFSTGFPPVTESPIAAAKTAPAKVSKKKTKKTTHSHTISSIANNLKKVSDSRLSAQGLAQVLHLKSPEEALEREKYILDIFERELHYPLGYKTWIRDTKKQERIDLIDQLYQKVKVKYPDYNHEILETIIRRATYYMMQSRLRRERRAKTKGKDLDI